MRKLFTTLAIAALFGPAVLAQQWEITGEAGYGLYRNANLTSPAGTAKGGFAPGTVFSVLVSQNLYRYFGGEPRYLFSFSDLKLSNSQDVRMTGQSHTFDYDFLLYARPTGARIRPFVAAGAGARWFRGTGPQGASQPLSRIAVLTHTSEWDPEISLGAGVKFLFHNRGLFRLDFRDYASPLPKTVVAPVPPGTASGWLHNFVFMAGIGVTL